MKLKSVFWPVAGTYVGALFFSLGAFTVGGWLGGAILVVGSTLGCLFLFRAFKWLARPDLVEPTEQGYTHPATGRYCHVCGAERDVEPCNRERHLDPANRGRYCHICKADAALNEPCDAGLHS